MQSMHRQSLLARRLTDFHVEIETQLEYSPENFQQMAGLIIYYDTTDYAYLCVTHHEARGRCLGIIESRHGQYDELLTERAALPEGPIRLMATIHNERLQFHVASVDEAWRTIGDVIDIRHLSDDAADYIRFTGTFVGLCAQDLGGRRRAADFSYFDYRPLP